MKRFLSIFILGIFFMNIAFSSYVKVPKKQKKQFRFESAPTVQVEHAQTTPIVYPNARNSAAYALIDSSGNGYGLVAANTRPLWVDADNETWFAVYRQYAGEQTTHGQIGGAYSEDGTDWSVYTNLNYNGNPPWGGGTGAGQGGLQTAQGRYPSALGDENQPIAIWNEYAANPENSNGSSYDGRPYWALDQFGWDGGSFSYPTDLDLLWSTDTKDLWVGSVAISYDDAMGMSVINAVYNDWTRNDRYLFHSEVFEDGFVVFGQEQLVISETQDLVGGDADGSFNTSPYLSFTPDGQGMVGIIGLFLGADTDESSISNYHTGIFKLSDDHGASWYGGSSGDPAKGHATGVSGDNYYFIPDAVFDDLVSTQFGYIYEDECAGTSHILDDFWTYYEDDMKVDIDGDPHFVLQVLPCESTEEGSCWYMPESGLYHFTIDKDHIDNPGALNTPEGWNWSFVMSGEATYGFADLTAAGYIGASSVSLAFSKDNADIVYVATNMATPGDAADPSVFNDPCYVTQMSDYPEWSEDVYIIKSETGGNTWWNPLNSTNTPDLTGGVCPSGLPKCDPAETYPHTSQWGTNDDVYVMYQTPNWAFNEIGDLFGADFMQRVWAGTVTVDDSNIPDYTFDAPSGCYADAGDVTGDGVLNVLDIVGLVNHILGIALLDDTCAADYTGDTVTNVLDIVGLVNNILGIGMSSLHGASTADIMIDGNNISVRSDGCVQGVELNLSHNSDLQINLDQEDCDMCIAEYNKINANTTKVLVVKAGEECITNIGDFSGNFDLSNVVMSNHLGQEVGSGQVLAVSPLKVKVSGPNPFNPSTSLNVVVPTDGYVSVKIYNIVGQEVATLQDGFMAENFNGYTLNWNASNLASGVYLVRAEAAGQVSFEKLMLLK